MEELCKTRGGCERALAACLCNPALPGLFGYREVATCISLQGAQVTAFTGFFWGKGELVWME